MHINYREWDTSGIVFGCNGEKYLAAPEDLVLSGGRTTEKGFFEQDEAKWVNRDLASGWMIPTHAQMLAMAKVCKDISNGHSYWTDDADCAYNPGRGCNTPQFEIDKGMLACRIRCVCDLTAVIE